MLNTPLGAPALSMDRTMLMSMWAKKLIQEPNLLENPNKQMLLAGIGHPTLPVDLETAQFAANYWKSFVDDVSQFSKQEYTQQEITAIANNYNLVRHYGLPQGEICYRAQAAQSLSSWYETPIDPDHVMFTHGGCASLFNVFRVLEKQNPEGARIILPTPCYPLHISTFKKQISHPLNVLEQPGYKITAIAIQKSIDEALHLAKRDHAYPKAIILCDPYNPLGTTLDKDELPKIVKVLEMYPDILLVLDEPYAEMTYGYKHVSLLKFCESIKDRVIAIRSATKSFSLAGERMSLTICQNKYLMNHLVESNILISGHAATSQQAIYAFALSKMDAKKLKRTQDYYEPQLEFAYNRLREMGANMPDDTYKPDATFYILCDLKDLYYLKRSPKSFICDPSREPHTTAEEVAYTLLFSESILITPLSYYGMQSDTPYFRITCGIGIELLTELFDRLESKLIEARTRKRAMLLEQLHHLLSKLDYAEPLFAKEARQTIAFEVAPSKTISLAKQLKHSIQSITYYLLTGSRIIKEFNIAAMASKQHHENPCEKITHCG
jgi:aspartate/methionine/tyrosine aminotransferase